MEQLNKAEVRATIMVDILEYQDETLPDSMNEQIISKKFLEAYTIKDALEVIEILMNKNK